ncbi:MAG: hypothetical protein GWP91_10425 [Rhodobacterales bacterium]|nr:hypothetical protein [Rhodobacterales bacterium]
MVTITLDGPAKNALGTDMMRSIVSQLQAADGQPVLITGSGDSFSAGLDLKELVRLDEAGMTTFLHDLDALVDALFRYSGPTAAAVNGHAIAGGCIVALCCDVRIGTTAQGARLGLTEVALGLRFPPRTLEMVVYRLPHRWVEEIIMGAALHSPKDALRLGLVDTLSDDCVGEATRRLKALSRHPADAYAAAKATLRGNIGVRNNDVDRVFEEEVLPVWCGPELRAVIQSFLGQR